MTNSQAIVIGSCIIAATLIITNMHSANAQLHGGPYQLMHHSNTVANAGIFRLDTSSGAVSYCFIGSDQNLNCTKETR